MTRPPRILIVEHEHAMRHGLCLHLELDGCACYTSPNVVSAIQRGDLGSFDLVMCGLTSGLFEAQRIIDAVRAVSGDGYVPILMLATDATRAAAIVGLEQGADGFLVKPFGFRELVASVRALLRTRPFDNSSEEASLDPAQGGPFDAAQGGAGWVDDGRAPSWSDSSRVCLHGLDVDPARRRVRVQGRDVRLTEQEFQLLYVLAANAGRVFTRGALLTRIWGETFVSTRSVDALVKRVRRRLEAVAGRPAGIQAVRGVGYRFNAIELRRSA